MAFFDKLMFWKKKELALPSEKELGLPKMPEAGFGAPLPPAPTGYEVYELPQQFPAAPQYPSAYPARETVSSKDIEIISSKLDAIKAHIESINRRLENIERIAKSEEEEREREARYRRSW